MKRVRLPTRPYPLRAHLAEVDGLDARDDLPDVRLRAAGHTPAAGLPASPPKKGEHRRGADRNTAAAAAAPRLGGAVPERRCWLSLGAEQEGRGEHVMYEIGGTGRAHDT